MSKEFCYNFTYKSVTLAGVSFSVVAAFAGTNYLIQGKRRSDQGDWLYLDGARVNDSFTHWDNQINPFSNNKKTEFIVLQPQSSYTWLNREESELVSGYICEG